MCDNLSLKFGLKMIDRPIATPSVIWMVIAYGIIDWKSLKKVQSVVKSLPLIIIIANKSSSLLQLQQHCSFN